MLFVASPALNRRSSLTLDAFECCKGFESGGVSLCFEDHDITCGVTKRVVGEQNVLALT